MFLVTDRPRNSIVGKGKHSKNNVPKIKPAVEEYCQSRGLEFSEGGTKGRPNPGRLYIRLQNSLPTSVKHGGMMETHTARQPASTRRTSAKKPPKQPISPKPTLQSIPSLAETHTARQPASTRRASAKKPPKQNISSKPSLQSIPSPVETVCGSSGVFATPPRPVPPADVRPPTPRPHVQDSEGESPKVPKESSPNWVLWGLVAVVGISLLRKYVRS